jgi:hypothetical protein
MIAAALVIIDGGRVRPDDEGFDQSLVAEPGIEDPLGPGGVRPGQVLVLRREHPAEAGGGAARDGQHG